MTAFNPGDGWELGVTGPSRSGEEYIEHVVGGEYRRWFRTHPVPALPTEPYTVIRVEWKRGCRAGMGDVLTKMPNIDRWVDWGGQTTNDVTGRLTRFEVLAEPRAVTAKAVLDAVREHDNEGLSTFRRSLDRIARDFGVSS